MAKRNLRPRETSQLAITPIAVSTRTCAAAFGFEPTDWRRWLIAVGCPHQTFGRLVVARTDDVLEALARSSKVESKSTEAVESDGDDQLTSADEVLEAVGVRRAS